MRNGKDRNSCLFGEELVAYIYGELDRAERSVFEMHLLDCGGCTAELADISLSRLGVYEWHRDGFVPLATPHFEIPYHVPAAPSVFWIDALRNLVWPVRIAFAGGSLAAIAFGLIVISIWNSSDTNIASANISEVKVNETSPADKPISEDLPDIDKTKGDQGSTAIHVFKSVRPARQVRVAEAKTSSIRKQQNVQLTSASSSPRLGSFVEPEDTSLRLADLVADIDTKDIK